MVGVGGRCVAIAATCSAETSQALEGLGHVGKRGNEIADELARKDAEKASVGPEPIMRKAKITSSRNIFTDGESCVTGSHRELLRGFRMHQMVA